MNTSRIIRALQERFRGETIEARRVPMDESIIALPRDCIHPAVEMLIDDFALRHLSTITGEDQGHAIRLLYHFWGGRGLTLATTLPRETPTIASLTDLIPGATFYEREVSEMLGVNFSGHQSLRPLLLPEDWEGGPPLRRSDSTLCPRNANVDSGKQEDEL